MLYPSVFRQSDPFSLMDSMLRGFGGAYEQTAPQGVFPPVNIWQGPEAIAITAELPGVEADAIDITVKENVLTLSGERKPPQVPEGATWHRNERVYGKFARAIRLPFSASEENVEARLQNGVLLVVVGRPEKDRPRKIEIKAA